MTQKALVQRIQFLEHEISHCIPAERADLLAHLEDVVRALEAAGGTAPHSALRRLEARTDAEVEALFDNLPV